MESINRKVVRIILVVVLGVWANLGFAANETEVEDEVIEMASEHHDDGPGWPEANGTDLAEARYAINQASATRGNRAAFPRIIQPISFINFVMTDGTGRNSYETFQKQVDQLNAAFSGADARAAGYSKATDSNIRFKLAGVRYVVNDDLFNLCALPSKISQYRPKYMMNGAIHFNVYVCWCENNLGLAWLPYLSWFRQVTGESHFALGAIVHWNLLPGNNMKGGLWSKGNILTHETGHVFGLMHPYQGDCFGSESDSDGIDDTPRMTGNPLTTCKAVRNRDSCKSLPGDDDMQNFMVATADTCRNHFTPGQIVYMQNVITTYKPTLMKQLLPSCVAAIDSDDNSPDLQPCLAGSTKVSSEGKRFCLTDPDDSTVWGWACCPQSLDWDSEPCRQGVPNFSKPANRIELPRAVPTKNPTRTPVNSPTKRPNKLRQTKTG